MANEYPFRSAIGPGTTTITADPNNPWDQAFGGQMSDQSMILDNEDPTQTIMRLAREGLSVDQISQMTGIPQEEVAMQVSVMQGDRSAFMPGGEFGEPYLGGPETNLTSGGIGSFDTEMEMGDLDMSLEDGNSITDLVMPELNLDIDPADYLTETELVVNMEKLGFTDDEKDDQAKDNSTEDTLLDQVIASSTAGSIANGEDDTDSNQTIQAMLDMNSEFDSDDPDDQKEMLNIYKKAAEMFYDTDDLKELIPQPDKSLPYMVAGAALIQSGSKGESWGQALSNAFLQYSLTEKKEEKDYEKSMLGLELKERQDINNFAMQLYMADYKEQKALERALLTKEKKPYKVNSSASPVYYTTYQAGLEAGKGNSVIPWTAEDGGIKEYTIFTDADGDGQPDATSPAITQLLSEAGAQNKQTEGYIIREGNLTKGKKLYLVDNVAQMYSSEELESFMNENPDSDVRVVGASSAKAVRNRATGELTWVDNRELLTPRGREMYSPIGQENTIVFGPDGDPIMMTGDAAGMGTLMTGSQRGKEEQRVREFLIQTDQKRDNILTTHSTIKDLLSNQNAKGEPVVFGVAGSLTTFGKNVIDQVDQLKTVFTDPKSGYAFYTDSNGNGKRDPGESSTDFGSFSKQFEDTIANTNLGRFLQGSGLGKKRLTNMVLTLALQSAANDDQKGRDISDKDIERFLTRAGAFATSEEEFITVIDDLALGAIRKHESLVDSEIRYAARLQMDPDSDEKMTMIDFMYPNLVEEQGTQKPFRDAPYTIAELKEQLIASVTGSGINSITYQPNVSAPGQPSVVLPGGNEQSGWGNQTIHGVWEEFKMLDDSGKIALTKKLRDTLGQDSPEYKAIVDYIKRISGGGQ